MWKSRASPAWPDLFLEPWPHRAWSLQLVAATTYGGFWSDRSCRHRGPNVALAGVSPGATPEPPIVRLEPPFDATKRQGASRREPEALTVGEGGRWDLDQIRQYLAPAGWRRDLALGRPCQLSGLAVSLGRRLHFRVLNRPGRRALHFGCAA